MKFLIFLIVLFSFSCISEEDNDQKIEMDVPSAIKCDLNSFEFETEFRGPGWDGDNKIPFEPLENYFVTTTVAILREGSEIEKGFQDFNNKMEGELDSRDGHIATKFAGSSQCRTARTLTIWKSNASINAFVSSPTHILSIGRALILTRGGATTRWESTSLPTWADAHEKLALKKPFIY